MNGKLDNTRLWNEAAKAGLLFGLVSVSCLALKELAGMSGSTFLSQAAFIVLWAVEFFGCILLMKKYMLDLRDKFDGVSMVDTYRFGRRVGLLSGLIFAAANAILIIKTPQETITGALTEISASLSSLGGLSEDEVGRLVDKLPLYTFIFQWIYCFLYGSVLSAIMSRYIFARDIFQQDGGNREDENDTVDNQ